jgi:hypothetical protein
MMEEVKKQASTGVPSGKEQIDTSTAPKAG